MNRRETLQMQTPENANHRQISKIKFVPFQQLFRSNSQIIRSASHYLAS